MNAPQFSICIPTYNRGHLLPAALESALGQTFSDFEIIVVDNASSDNTQSVLQQYDDPRIRSVRNERTVSMYANHNICTEHAKAPWIVFLHSDDQLRKSALDLYRGHIETGEVDCVYPMTETLRRAMPAQTSVTLSGCESLPDLLRYLAAPPSGALFKSSVIKSLSFDEDIVASDLMLLAELLWRDRLVKLISEDVVDIGVGDFQYSSDWHKSGKFIRDVSAAFKKIIGYPGVREIVIEKSRAWKPNEIAFLLCMLAHADEKALLVEIEEKIKTGVKYKNMRHYRHVYIYRLLGYRFLTGLFFFVKQVRRLAH